MNEQPVLYKKLEPVWIAAIKTRVENRAQLLALFEPLRAACGDAIAGDALAIFHGGAVQTGFWVEAAFPVKRPVESGEVYTRQLESASALTVIHTGPHTTIRETFGRVLEWMRQHAWTTSLIRREIYTHLDPDHPEQNVIEVQMVLHEWDRLLAEGTQAVLGVDARQKVMAGIEAITPTSSFDDYVAWIQGAIGRLDGLTSDGEKKCQIVSHCAHVFPQERIEHLRAIYERGAFDDILREMYVDDFWYEKPVRRGNVISMRKNPYDPEGYAQATTTAERRQAYCHCAFVAPFLKQEPPFQLSPTFCYCGAGWYRRLWEGILGQPVKIEHVETLLRGNEQCTLTITLPLALEGECHPQGNN